MTIQEAAERLNVWQNCPHKFGGNCIDEDEQNCTGICWTRAHVKRAVDLAIEALEEKAERDKDCNFCLDDYAVMSGSRMKSNGLHCGCTAKYCPNCGRKFTYPPKGE